MGKHHNSLTLHPDLLEKLTHRHEDLTAFSLAVIMTRGMVRLSFIIKQKLAARSEIERLVIWCNKPSLDHEAGDGGLFTPLIICSCSATQPSWLLLNSPRPVSLTISQTSESPVIPS